MRKFKVKVDGVAYSVEVTEEGVAVVAAPPSAPTVAPVQPAASAAAPDAPRAAAPAAAPAEVKAGETPITAPMPGKITKILAKAGQTVKKGEVLMLLEAMKMQNEIGAPAAGTVKSINVSAGENVKPGQVMAVIG